MPKELIVLRNAVHHNTWFAILTVTAIALIVASWFVPPMAVVDGSILAATGELLGFGALWTVVKAIDKGTPASMSHGSTTISVNKDRHHHHFDDYQDEIVRTEDEYTTEEEA